MLITIKTSAKNGASAQFREGVIACLPPFPVTGASVSPPALSGHYPVFPLQTALLASALYLSSAQFLFYSLWATGAKLHPLC
jgi:hypothetical protein